MAAQDDYNELTAWAKRLGLEGDDHDSYVNDAMKRLGHKAKTIWEDDTDSGKDSGGGDFFSRKRAERGGEGKSGIAQDYLYGGK